MASYQADIRIGVVGKDQLTRLEAQIRRVKDQSLQLQQALQARVRSQTLRLDTRQAMSQVTALERKLQRMGQSLKVSVTADGGADGLKKINEGLREQVGLLRDVERATRRVVTAETARLKLLQKISRVAKSAATERASESIERAANSETKELERQLTLTRAINRERERNSRGGGFAGAAGSALGRIDSAFGGFGRGFGQGALDMALRAGTVAAPFGLGAMYTGAGRGIEAAASHVPLIGKALVGQVHNLQAMQGQVGDLLQALGQVPETLGLAAVAAAALAPWLPQIGKGAVTAAKGIADFTGITDRAKPSVDRLKRSIESIQDNAFNSKVFDLGPNSVGNLNFPDREASAGAFEARFKMQAMLPKVLEEYNRQLQRAYDAQAKQARSLTTWSDALEQGREWQKDIAVQAEREAQARKDAAAALQRFKMGELAKNAEAVTRAMLRQQQVLDAYNGKTDRSQGFGYSGANPALRPSGYTNQDVRIANLLSDQAKEQAAANQKVAQSAAKTSFEYRLQFGLIERQTAQLAEELAVQEKIEESVRRENRSRERRARVARGREAQQRAGQLRENLMAGVGFPLLFGAGPASIGASAAGSFIGQGFGGQIFFGAIGQAIDNLVAQTATLGQALNPLSLDMEAVSAAAGLTGTRLAKLAGEADNAALAANVMALAIGDRGTRALREFGDAGTELGNALSRLTTRLMSFVAELAEPVTSALASGVATYTLAGRASDMSRSGGPEAERLGAARAAAFEKNPFDLLGAYNAELAETKKILEEQTAELERQARELTNSTEQRQLTLEIAEIELGVARSGGDLLNEGNVTLQRTLLLRQQELEHLANGNEYLQDRITFEELIEKNKLTQLKADAARARLDQQVQAAQQRAAEKAQRDAEKAQRDAERAQKKAEELQRKLANQAGRNQLTAASLPILRQIAEASRNKDVLKEAAARRNLAVLQSEEKIAEIRRSGVEDELMSLQITGQKLTLKQELQEIDLNTAAVAQQQRENLEAAMLSSQQEIQLAQAKTQLQKEILNIDFRIAELAKQNPLLTQKQLEGYRQLEMQRLRILQVAEQQRATEQMINQMMNSAGTQMAGVLDLLVQGTEDWNRALGDVLRTMSQLLLKLGIQALAGTDGRGLFSFLNGSIGSGGGLTGAIPSGGGGASAFNAFGGSSLVPGLGAAVTGGAGVFGGPAAAFPGDTQRALFGGGFGIPGFASGGITPKNSPFVVGENGPEVLMSPSAHRVVPNDQLGGVNSVINITVSDSGTTMDSKQSTEFGRLIEAGVIGVIQRERRPGGMLA